MKHIYIFNSSVRGSAYGVGTYISQLIGALKNTEYNVTVVNIINKDIEFDILKKNTVRYISIPAPVIDKNDLSNEAFQKSIPFILYPYIEKNEKNIFHLNFMGNIYLAQYLRLYFDGSIVITVHYTDWCFTLLGNRTKLQCILRNKEELLDTQSQIILKNLTQEKELLNICDKIVSLSKHSYHDLLKIHKVDKNKLLLINNALKDSFNKNEDNKSAIRKKFCIDHDDIILVFAGRLNISKGIDILINSFKFVIEKHPNAHLFIAGEGEFSMCLSVSSPIWKRISFTGFLFKKNLHELYSIADIGIIPSLHEAFGYVAVEMMSHEIPVVVNNISGLSEIIDDNINGLKVTVNSNKKTWWKLADRINYLIENPDERKRIGKNAREKYKTHYNLKLFKERMLALYDSL